MITPEQRVGTAQELHYIETSLREGVTSRTISREFADKIHDFMNAHTEPEDEPTEPSEDVYCDYCLQNYEEITANQIALRKIDEYWESISSTKYTLVEQQAIADCVNWLQEDK